MKWFLMLLLAAIIALFLFKSDLFKNERYTEKSDKNAPLVRIAIVNGCGINGAANDVRNYFIHNDFPNIDVLFWKDGHQYIYEKSIIVVKKNNSEKLNHLREITGIKRKIYAISENSMEDFQIIVGRDFQKYFK
jgi:hypothetical protein